MRIGAAEPERIDPDDAAWEGGLFGDDFENAFFEPLDVLVGSLIVEVGRDEPTMGGDDELGD